MRKLGSAICLSAALLAAGAAQAQWEGNWLVGGFGGWAQREGNVSATFFDTADDELTSVSTHIRKSSWIWGLLGGYQARCNGWLLGAELEVDWANKHSNNNFQFTDADDNSVSASVSYKRNTNVGLSGRIGYQVATWLMPYLRAGIETSRDRLSVDAEVVDVATNTVIAALDIDGSRRVYRGVFGVGIELPIPQVSCLSIRAEYDYHTKGRSVHADGFADDGVTFVDASTKQRINSGIIALVWNFM